MLAGPDSRACRSASRSAIRTAGTSSVTTSSRRAATTARARSKRTTPRSPGTSTPTKDPRATTSGTARRSAAATSCRSGPASGGCRTVAWQRTCSADGRSSVSSGSSSGFPFTVTSTNVCQCGSFVPQRVNFAPGREDDAGNISDGTVSQWFDPTAYLVPANGTQGTAGRNTVRGPGDAARRLLAHQAVSDRQGARRIPMGGLQPLQPRELRHARFQHLQPHRRHDYVGRRRTQHAIRTAVHLVGARSRCLRLTRRSRMH